MPDNTRTREEIVTECRNAVASCWNYYNDNDRRLDDTTMAEIKAVLSQNLPSTVKTGDWQKYADEYDKRIKAEST